MIPPLPLLLQVHLRHMVGGPAVLGGGEVPDERIFVVEYPELRGMLAKLLTPISPRWDITLLHFRKTGQRAATALLGLRLPAGEVPAFEESVAALNAAFQFRELRGKELEVFRLFV
jgi:threonine dehydratase